MTFHDHDHELIMAIAEGADVSNVERTAIAECPECAAKLAAQLVALAALRSAPTVAVTELESARLLRHLDTELGHVRQPAEVRSVRARRRFSWAPAFSIAAVLLALVLVAPRLNLLGGGDDAASESFDVALSATTTTAVASGGALELSPAARLQEAAPEDGAADATVPPTTIAPAADGEVTTAADNGFDLDAPPTLTDLRSIIEDAGGDPQQSRERVAEVFDLMEPETPNACLTFAVAEVGDVVASFTLGELIVSPDRGAEYELVEAVYVIVTVHEHADRTVVLVAHDPVTCLPVATLP